MNRQRVASDFSDGIKASRANSQYRYREGARFGVASFCEFDQAVALNDCVQTTSRP
jgi:hypothetical protein